MAIDQRRASVILKILKRAQIVLAILVTGFLALLLPGAVGTYGVPLGCLYIAWAVRASFDHRFSVWLACLFTLAVALMGGLAVVAQLAGLLSGRAAPLTEFSLELMLFIIAAAVVVLHGIHWRWLLSPATGAQP